MAVAVHVVKIPHGVSVSECNFCCKRGRENARCPCSEWFSSLCQCNFGSQRRATKVFSIFSDSVCVSIFWVQLLLKKKSVRCLFPDANIHIFIIVFSTKITACKTAKIRSSCRVQLSSGQVKSGQVVSIIFTTWTLMSMTLRTTHECSAMSLLHSDDPSQLSLGSSTVSVSSLRRVRAPWISRVQDPCVMALRTQDVKPKTDP